MRGEDPLAEIHSLRAQLSQASEQNDEKLRSFLFNRSLGSVCLFDIDDILDEINQQLSRVEMLIQSRDKGTSAFDVLSTLVRTEAAVAIQSLESKRRRIQLSTRICGVVPIIVTRADVALSLVDEAALTLSRLK